MSGANKTPVGLRLPLQRGSNGFFDQNFDTLKQASTNIRHMLLTIKGERRMNANFGSNLYRLLFEQNTSEIDLTEQIKSEIQNLINLYFPYVDILYIEVLFADYNNNLVNVNISFKLKNSTDTRFGISAEENINITINTGNLG